MIRVPGGVYRPFYPIKGEEERALPPFWLDAAPVTNEAFAEFVKRHPEWRRSKVARLFADDAYLSHWKGDLELGEEAGARQPVTFVSWFAASAYCRAQEKRLPAEAEWEFAANPRPDDEALAKLITERSLTFYSRPRGELPQADSAEPNPLGLRGMHGVIWEWVEDFNASLVSPDNRQEGDPERKRFCGGAAVGAEDVEDYATFMRLAFRSSLEATYAVHNLGFRCARSIQ